MIRSVVRGIGSALPRRIMKNADFEGVVETSDEWIAQRTGIRERHIAADDETTASLGEAAAREALANAGLTPDDIDLVVLATSTPNNTFPATAVDIQQRLGMRHGFAFDLQAVCSGFVYAVTTADLYLRGGLAKRVLVIGAETFSRILDWTDRSTCVLFGDGAGAVILEADKEGRGTIADRGVLAASLRSDGFHVIEGTFSAAGITAQDLDWFVPHQANKRIIDASARKLGIAEEKVVITVDRHGNTSAASVPLALAVAVKDGRIKKGDLVLLEAMGGGFTWGAVLIRW
jgi:3-oxoacyl-[acyl-carrier-protein] synthase III